MSSPGSCIRVALVTQSLGWGGLERVVLDLARGLDRGRWQPVAVSLSAHTPMAPEFAAAGVPVHVLPQRGLDLSLPWRLAAWLRAEGIGLVHAHNFGRYFYAGPAARLAGVPSCYTEHSNVGRHERALWLTQPWLSRLAPVVVADAEEVRARLYAEHGLPAAQVRTIPNGIDLAPYARAAAERDTVRGELGLPPEALVVATVGRLVAVKHQSLLLRAFAALLHGRAAGLGPAHLLLAGDGPLRAELEALAGELGLARRVTFLGLRRDIPRVLAACDVFALTSHSEGLPIAVLEAMAAGLPVVATAVGGVPELVQDGRTGLLVPPGAVGPLTAALAALADATLRRALGQAARLAVEADSSLEVMVARYERIYELCLAAQPDAGRLTRPR